MQLLEVMPSLDEISKIAGIVQAVATIVAIIIGGIWTYKLFVIKRQKFPRANITHSITHKVISDSKLLLNVAVKISNTGDVLLSLVSGKTRVQQILPLSNDLIKTINEGRDPVKKKESEVRWPLIDERMAGWQMGKCEIEPGEADQVVYDFILDSRVKTIEVYSYFENIRKRGRKIGWHLTSIYDIR